MSQLVSEAIKDVVNILEAEIPANPVSAQNVRRAHSLERMMRDYFNALEQAFPYESLSEIYYREVT